MALWCCVLRTTAYCVLRAHCVCPMYLRASTRGRCRVCGIEPDSGRELHSFVSATSAPAVAGADHKNIGARPGGAGCSWSFWYAQHRGMRADRLSQFITPQRHAPTSNDVESGKKYPPEWRRFRGKFDARRAVWVTWLTAPGRHGGIIDDRCRLDGKHAGAVPCLRDRAGQRPRIAQLCKRRGRRRHTHTRGEGGWGMSRGATRG